MLKIARRKKIQYELVILSLKTCLCVKKSYNCCVEMHVRQELLHSIRQKIEMWFFLFAETFTIDVFGWLYVFVICKFLFDKFFIFKKDN